MEKEKVTSVQALLSYLKIFDKKYGEKTEYGGDTPKVDFWFRGSTDKSYELIPKFLREGYHGVSDFMILENFKKEASGYIDSIYNYNDLNWLQYAQHYGVPTRLLDFSANPLVALFFSCSSNMSKDGALWILNKFIFDRFVSKNFIESENLQSISNDELINNVINKFYKDDYLDETNISEYPVSFIPSYIDRRMEAQLSRFLIWGNKDSSLEKIIKAENIMKVKGYIKGYERKEFLAKLIIPVNKKREILNQLDLIGINEKTVFPGLDGIGKYIDNYYRE